MALTPVGHVATGLGPAFMAVDAQHRWLVTINEMANAVESYAISPTTGALTRISGAAVGANPAFVSLDATGKWVAVANFDDGTISLLPIDANGTLGTATTLSPGANTHEVVFNATNTLAYVPCLGADQIAIYGFDASTGALTAHTPVSTPVGTGPRHLAFSADGQTAWLISETASTVTTYTVGSDGSLTAGASLSTLTPGFSGMNMAAELRVHPSGKWLYASNRGDDSIAVFAIGAGGVLTKLANVPSGGETPTGFTLTPDGKGLLVANTFSNTIDGFRIDPQTGLLTSAGELANGLLLPAFIGFVQLD
jgi:6-phosphogluconolactonase